jgi:RNA polymerase sigma-70 factor, ECF subfamily
MMERMRITIAMSETALPDIDRLPADGEEAAELMDEETFRRFYERTARGLWTYLARITGDRQAADDLLQEAYYRFYRAGADHESESHRRNSLFCIATNLARDAGRRHRGVSLLPLPNPGEPREPRAPDELASRVESRTDLTRAMTMLPPRQREMLWLAYALGASHEEIAETLGLKARSIRVLLFRARRALAALLRDGRTARRGRADR